VPKAISKDQQAHVDQMRQVDHKNAGRVADDLVRRYLRGDRLYRPYNPNGQHGEGPYVPLNKPDTLWIKWQRFIFMIEVKLGRKEKWDWL
jgi:hypothetical protein